MIDRTDRSHPLHGAFAKLDRAQSLAHALRNEIDAHIRLVSGADIVRADTRTHFAWRYRVAPYPTIWAVRLGEVVHHCRSALEHMLTAFAIAEKAAQRRPQFPVCITRKQFRETAPSMMRGLSKSTVQFIADLQPFAARRQGLKPRATVIYLLHELWNIDKHRNVNLLVTSADLRAISVTPRHRQPGELVAPLGPLKANAWLFKRPKAIKGLPVSIDASAVRDIDIADTGKATPSTRNIGKLMDSFVAFTNSALTSAHSRFYFEAE